MRSLITILLFIPIGLKAQKKSDNTIVVDTTRTIQEIKIILFNNGYAIDGNDTTVFVTTPKQMKWASVMRIMIARTNNSIIIKGQYKEQIETSFTGLTVKREFEPIDYRPSKQNLFNTLFLEMATIAKAMGSKITYLKQ